MLPPALHAEVRGSGPPLVLLHAFPLDLAMFGPLVEHLDGRACTVAVDLPGLGDSPTPEGPPSTAAAAAAVVATVDALGLGRVDVLGISTGGYVAMELVARWPERVGVLGLGSTTSRLVAPDVPQERADLADEVERAGSVATLLATADDAVGPTSRERDPALVDRVRGWIGEQRPDGVAWMARAIAARHDRSAAVASHEGPVLLLNGAEDDQTPLARGQELAALRPGRPTTAHVLPATGHLTPLEAPDAVAAALLDLVGTAPPSGRPVRPRPTAYARHGRVSGPRDRHS